MHFNFVKATNRRYLEELKNIVHQMPVVYKSVNIMQHTEWVINKPIYEVIKTCMLNDFPLGKLPVNPQTIELPIKPVDIATNKEALIKWKREASKVYSGRAKQNSKFIQVRQIMEEAKMLLDKGGFFYPYQLDFRSRVYPKPAMLSPQSADYSRALLTFKFGKRIGKNFDVLAVAGAGLFGEVDKEELNIRVKWINDNMEKIIQCATTPLEFTWWADADKPFCFLAFCYEMKAYSDSNFDDGFITTLPIQADCSNSGLQHYSSMMRDEVGGKATNLVPSNKPSDVYYLVSQKVIEKLKLKTDEMAKKWLAYGVNRKICKKPVMCLPYSLTRYSCRQYLEDHVAKELNERGTKHEFGEDLFKATSYLTPIVWESINDVVVGARGIMIFLKTIARLVASENLPVTWKTPLGFPVQMMCYKKESKRVKTKMGDSIVKLSIASETDEIDKRKTAQSVCPNFIHSLDASVLQLAVVKAKEAGVDNFSMIHDSFGCTAPDNRIMANAIRDSFCEIYKKDVLMDFANEMRMMLSEKNLKKFPDMPTKGNLDLDLVKKSVFFCI
jgi:DNA-directed RNA polymerase